MTTLEKNQLGLQGRASLRHRLLDDHRRTVETSMRVAVCVDNDDPHGALLEWSAFENGLLAHMNAEELYVLPRFAEIDRAEARSLREEHDVLRAELGELGLRLELHTARKPMFDALIARIWRHAEREDELMYAWAERSLSERVRDAVVRHLHTKC